MKKFDRILSFVFEKLNEYKPAIANKYKPKRVKLIEDTQDKVTQFQLFCEKGGEKEPIKDLINSIYANVTKLENETRAKEIISSCFFKAIIRNRLDVIQYLIFDLNIEIDDSTKQNIKEKYKEVENYFELREVNRELSHDLGKQDTTNNNPKAKKIKM